MNTEKKIFNKILIRSAIFGIAYVILLAIAKFSMEFFAVFQYPFSLENISSRMPQLISLGNYDIQAIFIFISAACLSVIIIYLPSCFGWFKLGISLLLAAFIHFLLWFFLKALVYFTIRVNLNLDLLIYSIKNLSDLVASELSSSMKQAPLLLPVVMVISIIAGILLFFLYLKSIAKLKKEVDSISEGNVEQSAESQAWKNRFGVMLNNHRWVMAVFLVFLASLPFSLNVNSIVRDSSRRMAVSPDTPVDEKRQAMVPLPDRIVLPEFPYQNNFYKRYGFTLEKGTNVVVFMLEGARKGSTDLNESKYFKKAPEVVQSEYFFIPVPHSTNTHYSFYTGLHSSREFEQDFKDLDQATALTGILKRKGYATYYVYSFTTHFEKEHMLLTRLGLNITEMKDFVREGNPDTGKAYKRFKYGVDDIALYHRSISILDSETGPFFLTLVFGNTHYPYWNPEPSKFNKYDNIRLKTLKRYKNGILYSLHVADLVVEEFIRRGLAKKTLFILLSDHGESFGEHGSFLHSFAIYNTEVHVPFAMRHPIFTRIKIKEKLKEAGRVQGKSASVRSIIPHGVVIDVYPTILEMLGVPFSKAVHGRSLFDREYELHSPLWSWGLDDYRGFIIDGYKWVYNREDETLFRMDLNDSNKQVFKESEKTKEFVDALFALDYGKAKGAVGVAGSEGSLVKDVFFKPTIIGGGFQTGGGRLSRFVKTPVD